MFGKLRKYDKNCLLGLYYYWFKKYKNNIKELGWTDKIGEWSLRKDAEIVVVFNGFEEEMEKWNIGNRFDENWNVSWKRMAVLGKIQVIDSSLSPICAIMIQFYYYFIYIMLQKSNPPSMPNFIP